MADLDVTIGLESVLSGQGVGGIVGMVSAVKGLVSSLEELSQEGDRAENVFAALRTDVNEASAALDGQVSKLDLAVQANRLLSAGVQLSSKELRAMALAAKQVSDTTGQDFNTTFERLTNVVRRGTDRMHEFGLEAKGTDGMLAELVERFGEANNLASTNADRIDQLRTRWVELRTEFAQGVNAAPALEELLSGLTGVNTQLVAGITNARLFGQIFADSLVALANPIAATHRALEDMFAALRGGETSVQARARREVAAGQAALSEGLTAFLRPDSSDVGPVASAEDLLLGRSVAPERHRSGGGGGGRRRSGRAEDAQAEIDSLRALSDERTRVQNEMTEARREERNAEVEARTAFNETILNLEKIKFDQLAEMERDAAATSARTAAETRSRIAAQQKAQNEILLNDASAWAAAGEQIAMQGADAFGANESAKTVIAGLGAAAQGTIAIAGGNYPQGLALLASATFAFATAVKQEQGHKVPRSNSSSGAGGAVGGGGASLQTLSAPANNSSTVNVYVTGTMLHTKGEVGEAVRQALISHADRGRPLPPRAVGAR